MAIDENEQWDWWMLSFPLELAVMRRMGLEYPTAEEFRANGYVHKRPLPDMQIVREELAKLEAGVYDDPLAVAIHQAVMDDDLDAHVMDELGATLSEEEQRERFGGYGRREE